MIVSVTQFLLPDGRQRLVSAEVPDDLRPQVEAIQQSGCRLTAEVLTTDEVSQCIEHPDIGDFDHVLSPTGPEATKKLRLMVARFDKAKCDKWKADQHNVG